MASRRADIEARERAKRKAKIKALSHMAAMAAQINQETARKRDGYDDSDGQHPTY